MMIEQKLEYFIVENDNAQDLAKAVNEMCRSTGAFVIGGVAVVGNMQSSMFYQAMAKTKQDDKQSKT